MESYESQDRYIQEDFDNHLYTIMGTFSANGFNAERFDNIKDFTRSVALVPVSAKTGEGIPELLSVLVGLTQQYLKDQLSVTDGPGKGSVLEVKEEAGLGTTVNAIIYDGILRKGDAIVVGGKEKPIATKVRAVLLPKPLDEIRDPRDRFSSVNSVSAASGVKIAAPDLETALAGAPLYVVPSEDQTQDFLRQVSEEVEKVKIATDINGVVLKTDALGSLEAIAEILKREAIPIRLADIGDVSKRDIVEARIVKDHDPLFGAVLAFNVRVLQDAAEEAKNNRVRIFQHNIIYHLIDEFVDWITSERNLRAVEEFDSLVKPAKIRMMSGYVFRKARPAIVGVEVLVGRIRPRIQLVKKNAAKTSERSSRSRIEAKRLRRR